MINKGKIYRVRFHLQPGPNFMNWQVKDERGTVKFYKPNEVTLVMEDCTLKNRRRLAEKIYRGAHKTVCAWVQCSRVTIVPNRYEEFGIQVNYSPRVHPFWEINGKCLDNKNFRVLITDGKFIKVLLPKHLRDLANGNAEDKTV